MPLKKHLIKYKFLVYYLCTLQYACAKLEKRLLKRFEQSNQINISRAQLQCPKICQVTNYKKNRSTASEIWELTANGAQSVAISPLDFWPKGRNTLFEETQFNIGEKTLGT